MSELKPKESIEIIEQTSGAGFSDWKVAASALRDKKLIATFQKFEADSYRIGRNVHHDCALRLGKLALPTHDFIVPNIREFLDNPTQQLDKIPYGDYYFASIQPGMHLAHETNTDKVIEFVQTYAEQMDEKELSREIYISHNGEAAMSGHIIVHDDALPNTITAEFTNQNFNAFHRGYHSPEIAVWRRNNSRFDWEFRGRLASGSEWRNDDFRYECFGGLTLTKREMAQAAFRALQLLPQDDGYYRPGYYEVLLERSGNSSALRPVFIEAMPK